MENFDIADTLLCTGGLPSRWNMFCSFSPFDITESFFSTFSGAAIDGSAGITGEYWNLHGNAVVKIQVTTAVVVPEEPNPGTNPGNGENQGDENNQDPQVDPQVRNWSVVLISNEEHIYNLSPCK